MRHRTLLWQKERVLSRPEKKVPAGVNGSVVPGMRQALPVKLLLLPEAVTACRLHCRNTGYPQNQVLQEQGRRLGQSLRRWICQSGRAAKKQDLHRPPVPDGFLYIYHKQRAHPAAQNLHLG